MQVVQQGNTITVTPNTQHDDGNSFQEVSNAVEQQELNKKSSWPELVGQDCKVNHCKLLQAPTSFTIELGGQADRLCTV